MNIKIIIAIIISSINQLKKIFDLIFKRFFFLLVRPIFCLLLIPSIKFKIQNNAGYIILNGEFISKCKVYDVQREKYLVHVGTETYRKKHPFTLNQIDTLEIRYPILGEEIVLPTKKLINRYKRILFFIKNTAIFIVAIIIFVAYSIVTNYLTLMKTNKRKVLIENIDIIDRSLPWEKNINLNIDRDIAMKDPIKSLSIKIDSYEIKLYNSNFTVEIDKKDIFNFQPEFFINTNKINFFKKETPECMLKLNNRIFGNNCGEIYLLSNLRIERFSDARILSIFSCKKMFLHSNIQSIEYKLTFVAKSTKNEPISKSCKLLFTKDSQQPLKTKQIENLQSMLLELGYNPGGIDGKYGPKTKKAIESFQRSEGLYLDGKITITLYNYLKHILQRKKLFLQIPMHKGESY